jgi:hypothetical protein
MLKQKPSPESVLITEQETEAIKKLQQIRICTSKISGK